MSGTTTITTKPDGTIDQPTLTQMLADARQAYHQLMIGGKPVTLGYNTGAGSKSVTYTPAEAGALGEYITSLERQLGIRGGRRSIRVKFGNGCNPCGPSW